MRSAIRDEPVQPLIALGTLGQLQAHWQMVGSAPHGRTPGDDEQFRLGDTGLAETGFQFSGRLGRRLEPGAPYHGAPTVKGTTATYMSQDLPARVQLPGQRPIACAAVSGPGATGAKDLQPGLRRWAQSGRWRHRVGGGLVGERSDQRAMRWQAFGLEDKKDFAQAAWRPSPGALGQNWHHHCGDRHHPDRWRY